MIRYFISYKNYIKVGEIEEDFNIYNEKLKLFKKNKQGDYRVEPIIYFNGYINDIKSFANILEKNKKGISLMVELNEKEITKFNPLYIKKFNSVEENTNIIKKDSIDNELTLINYNTYINMNLKESSLGLLVCVTKDNKSDKFFINIKDNMEFITRKFVISDSIQNDIYFYTDDLEIIEKYKNDTTVLKETDMGLYQIVKHKFLAIDSIPQTTVSDFNGACIRYLYKFCNQSIPIYKNILNNENYEFTTKIDKKKKKLYLLYNLDLKNIIYNPTILPLLKYINIYELDSIGYKKINVEEYMKRENILKYIKRPSKN